MYSLNLQFSALSQGRLGDEYTNTNLHKYIMLFVSCYDVDLFSIYIFFLRYLISNKYLLAYFTRSSSLVFHLCIHTWDREHLKDFAALQTCAPWFKELESGISKRSTYSHGVGAQGVQKWLSNTADIVLYVSPFPCLQPYLICLIPYVSVAGIACFFMFHYLLSSSY